MAIRKPAFTIAALEGGCVGPGVHPRTEPKEFVVSRTANGLYTISYTAGGEVPALLKGFYTSGSSATRATEDYLRAKNDASAG